MSTELGMIEAMARQLGQTIRELRERVEYVDQSLDGLDSAMARLAEAIQSLDARLQVLENKKPEPNELELPSAPREGTEL